jgi:O-antigen ligase
VATTRALPIRRALELSRPDLPAAGAWAFAAAVIVYLGASNGGFDPIVHQEVGLAVNWVLLIGVAAGILHPLRAGRAGVAAWVLLIAFTVWTATSWSWSESDERTAAEVARAATYVGVLGIGLSVAAAGHARALANGLLFGFTAIATVALLSRMLPHEFPDSIVGTYLPGIDIEARLAYPLNYSSALGAFAAMGIPLALWAARDARTRAGTAFAAATLPVFGVCLYLTTSGGALIVLAAAVGAYLLLTDDRLPQLATLVLGTVGALVLAGGVNRRPALDRGLDTAAAVAQGRELLLLAVITCLGVAAGQMALTLAARYARRPRWMRISRRAATRAAAGVAAVLLAGGLASGGAAEMQTRWETFKGTGTEHADPLTDTRADQLFSLSSSGRYDFWTVAADAGEAHPWRGIGAGTWDFWWNRNGTYEAYVRDSHSLFLDAFAELGFPGLALTLLLVGGVLVAGTVAIARGSPERRALRAGTVAAAIAFAIGAALDWLWELAVFPVAFALLASAALGNPSGRPVPALLGRAITVVVAAVAAVAIALPLAGGRAVEQSREAFAASDLTAALDAATRGRDAQPFAASPRLQAALIYERAGRFHAAAAAARDAAEREATNWRTWFILSRIEARRGRASAAVAALRRARSVRPTLPLLNR